VVSVAYFDTSALVKGYISESGSDWIRTLMENHDPVVFTSLLTAIETACTFARRQREGLLSSDDHHQLLIVFDYDFAYRYNVLGVDPTVIDTAKQMANRQPLRAYDAVHLATAWLLDGELLRANKSPLTFVCADERLITIAQAEGLLTDNPNHHP
jgi:predicted nucleic acid-binding protein